MDSNSHSHSHDDTAIGPVSVNILQKFFDKLSNSYFKEILNQKILDPITHTINDKIRPYVYIGLILYIIIVALLVVIIILLLKKNNRYRLIKI